MHFRSSVNDEELQHLQRLEYLVRLGVQETDVTEAGVAALQEAFPDCEIYDR